MCYFVEGQLRDIEIGEGFTFKVKDDQNYNQQRYEVIGEVSTHVTYTLSFHLFHLFHVY